MSTAAGVHSSAGGGSNPTGDASNNNYRYTQDLPSKCQIEYNSEINYYKKTGVRHVVDGH